MKTGKLGFFVLDCCPLVRARAVSLANSLRTESRFNRLVFGLQIKGLFQEFGEK